MQRTWVLSTLLGACLALGISAGVSFSIASGASGQQLAKPRVSVPRQIILSPKLVAGGQATLAVLDSQGRLLPNVVVELAGSQNVTTDITGRAIFVAPAEPGTMTAKISGLAVSASTSVVPPVNPRATPAAAASPEAPPAGLGVSSYPRVLEIHDRFTLEGSGFRSAADSNHLDLNGDPCLVLASSPVALVALPGVHAPVGDASLHVVVGGKDGVGAVDAGRFPVAIVLLEFSGPAEAMNAGSTGELILRATGTTIPLTLEVRNASPSVVQLAQGNVQRVKTSGGDDNSAPIEVKFVTGGNYTVTARLVSAGSSEPNLESAKKRLAEARKIAPSDWSARIDDVLLKIDRAPRDLPRIRAELRRMLDDKPAGALASLLDSAWRELN